MGQRQNRPKSVQIGPELISGDVPKKSQNLESSRQKQILKFSIDRSIFDSRSHLKALCRSPGSNARAEPKTSRYSAF